MSDHYKFSITAPLPLGLAASLMKLIGAAWPNARIGNDRTHAFAVQIPKSDVDGQPVDTEAVQAVAAEAREAAQEGANDIGLTSFGSNEFRATMPEELSEHIASIALSLFESYADANYLSISASLPATSGAERRQFEVTVQRAEKPTPHQLREKAEARVKELEAELAGLKPELTTTQDKD